MGRATRIIGIGLLVVGALLPFGLRFVQEAPLLLYLLPAALLVIGGFTFYRGRQLSARRAAPADLTTAGPRVLYLRAFTSDPTTVKQSLYPLLTVGLFSGLTSDEEQLVEVLRPFGRMVAIGQPGEWLPDPGAARVYRDDNAWQATVDEQMRLARLVIIRIGSGEGLQWELRHARAVVDPSRLLLFCARLSRSKLRRAIARAEDALELRLPPPHGAGFYRFYAAWQAQFLRIRAPLLRRSSYKPLRSGSMYALRPVFDQFGIVWTRPRISKLMVFAAVVAALFLLLFGLFIAAAVISSL
jgi:hypothetical protein